MTVKLKSQTLATWIARKNMTQNDFANRVKVSSGYMAQIMHDTRRPSPQLRQKMQKATGLEWDDLFEVVE
jgi:transcriptional regulator with XRE-family HTH domain